MKNIIKVWGIITMVVVIGLVFSCGGEADEDEQTIINFAGIPAGATGMFARAVILDKLPSNENNAKAAKAIAHSFPRGIGADGTSKGLILRGLDKDGNDIGAQTIKEGYVVIQISSDEDKFGSNDSELKYTGYTQAKVNLGKGTFEQWVTTYSPTIAGRFPTTQPPAGGPTANDYGTYTAPVVYKKANGTAPKEFIETIDLSATEFYISDNTNLEAGEGTPLDFLRFKITGWESASTPAAHASTYPNAYKFTGKMIEANEDTSTADYVKNDYIPSSKTAPGTSRADVKADESGPTFYMYIYFSGSTGSIKFIRTAFAKSGTPAVVTGDDGALRVYTKVTP